MWTYSPFFLSVFVFRLTDIQHPAEIFATLLPALTVSAPVKRSCDVFCAPRCQRPEASPSERCRGRTARCRLSLSGCRSVTPGSDTGPHRSPPRWRRWLQASPPLCRALKEILRQIAGLPAEIKYQGVCKPGWLQYLGVFTWRQAKSSGRSSTFWQEIKSLLFYSVFERNGKCCIILSIQENMRGVLQSWGEKRSIDL